MTSPVLPAAPRRPSGFTLLEIMVALAILAVGAVCVLSTFAAALMLHSERVEKGRVRLALDEARAEVQAAWDGFRPTKAKPLPDPIKDAVYSRDPAVTWSAAFEPVEGAPVGLDGSTRGAVAVVTLVRDGRKDRPREVRVPLSRTGFTKEDLRESVTYEAERRSDQQKPKKDPSERGPR